MYHLDQHCGGCQAPVARGKSFICLCSFKCHSIPLKPIKRVYNGTEFLSVESLMNAPEPRRIRRITMRFSLFFLAGENISSRSTGTDKQVNFIQRVMPQE